jgi:hypothetical protein
MKRMIFAFALISAGLCSYAAQAAAQTECFASSSAVFSAHPNATHASYTVRGKRCWYADAFKTQAKPEPHSAATAAPTPAPQRAVTAPAPQPRAAAAGRPSQWRAMAVAASVPRPLAVEFATEIPPAIARGFSRLLPVDESPTDFEGRFSVTGYKTSK